MALATMNENRRPKPKVTFFPGFEVIESKANTNPNPSERVNRIRTFEEAEKNSQEIKKTSQISSTVNFPIPVNGYTQKKSSTFRNFVVISLSILLIGGAVKWNAEENSHKLAIEKLEARNALASKCFLISEEDGAAKAGRAGSELRKNAVVAFYDRVVSSECIEFGDGSLFRNPFYGVNSNSSNWADFVSAFKYTAERWNGVEPFVLRCRDGWNSPSIGKRGACSHHGGVVSGFNEFKESNLADQIDSSNLLFPALAELEEAASR
jgi:hypothetical protein